MEVHPHWDTEPEQMGTKDKFWFRDPDDPLQCDWLFKFPTENTGRHWAEKIAYEIARKMRILAPRVELSQYCVEGHEASRGSAARSFSSGYELYHGNQVLAGMHDTYDPERTFGQSMHTIQRIFESMRVFESDDYAERCRLRLAEYLVLDAVIGNVDRHDYGLPHDRLGTPLPGQRSGCGQGSRAGRLPGPCGESQSSARTVHAAGLEDYEPMSAEQFQLLSEA